MTEAGSTPGLERQEGSGLVLPLGVLPPRKVTALRAASYAFRRTQLSEVQVEIHSEGDEQKVALRVKRPQSRQKEIQRIGELYACWNVAETTGLATAGFDEKVFETEVVRSTDSQVGTFRDNPSVYNAFVLAAGMIAEEDAGEAVHADTAITGLAESLKRENSPYKFNLTDYPSVALFLLNNREKHPDLAATLLASDSLSAHRRIGAEIDHAMHAIRKPGYDKELLAKAELQYVDPLVQVISEMEGTALSNPMALGNMVKLYAYFNPSRGMLEGSSPDDMEFHRFVRRNRRRMLRHSLTPLSKRYGER